MKSDYGFAVGTSVTTITEKTSKFAIVGQNLEFVPIDIKGLNKEKEYLSGVSGGSPPVPIVTGVAPNNGSAVGGTSVTITGMFFTGVTAVNFGLVSASFVFVDDAHITATSPAQSIGVINITVTTPNGTSATTPSDQFTYTFIPSDLSGLEAWWEGDTGTFQDDVFTIPATTNGTQVNSWKGKTPATVVNASDGRVDNVNIILSITSDFNGNPAVQFPGAAGIIQSFSANTPVTDLPQFSYFVVQKVLSMTGNSYDGNILWWVTGNNGFLVSSDHHPTDYLPVLNIGTSSNTNPINKASTVSHLPPYGPVIENWSYDGATVNYYVNNITIPVVNSTFSSGWSPSIQRIGQSAGALNANIAAILIYNSVLSSTNRANITTYLNNKYNVF